jgi:hypothetical protein
MNTPGTVLFNATLNTGDAVNDQILKFEISVSSVTLAGTSSTAATPNLLSRPAEVEFVHQAGTFEPLALANIPAGTYSGASFLISNPEIVVLNSGVPTAVPANLTATTVNAAFNPPIVVTNSGITTINFDLDLAGSVILNGSPVASASVTPVFNVSSFAVAASANQERESGEIDDAHGTVSGVAAPNFTIQSRQVALPFVTDAYTQFAGGVAQLSDLKVGDIVEVDGMTRPDGTKYASKVSRNGGPTGEEVEGIIATVTGSPATALSIAAQVDSSATATPPLAVSVAVNSGTVFSVRADKLNVMSMPAFDSSHIGKGQRIEADSSTAGFPTLATRVKLREQGLVGTIAAVPAPTVSGFTLNISPASAFGILSGAASVAVSVPNGVTLKVTPTAGASVLVRGLVFSSGVGYSMIAVRGQRN